MFQNCEGKLLNSRAEPPGCLIRSIGIIYPPLPVTMLR
jgi:hypothetical protein